MFNNDAEITALVLMGGGKGNIAGADIRYQGKQWPPAEPNLRQLIDVLERSAKPVVAALGPNTLGGGLELAMACAYRVIIPTGKVGQPEVNLGIPPGAGGTQRLPRLAGFKKALDMIVSGKPVGAIEAGQCGVVDQVIEQGSLLDGALLFAGALNPEDAHPATRDKTLTQAPPELFDQTRAYVSKKYRRLHAPQVCVDCVEAAGNMSFDDGLKYERQRFEECVKSDEAAALRHVFFAERHAGKVKQIAEKASAGQVDTIGVIGAGTMGSGITIALLKAGYQVRLMEQSVDALARGQKRIASLLQRDVEQGRLNAAQCNAALANLSIHDAIEQLKGVQLVIEAAFEEMSVKKAIFKTLGEVVGDAVLATNTSYLNIDEIAVSAGIATNQVLGMHFFSPANVMRLVEVVRAEHTSDSALLTALEVSRRAGKTAVIAGVCHGFIGNRMYGCYLREANFLIEEGALPEQVDAALTDFGFAMGPFAVSDLAGLDIGWANRKALASTRDKSTRYSVVADRICERGWFGQKTGRGFYRYDENSRVGHPDPEITALIEQASIDLNIPRRVITDEEIIQRCVYSLINEGLKILQEGIAQSASDIDIVWLYGYGFPRWRGGPMFYADQIGGAKILDAVEDFQRQHDFWQPAAKLIDKVASGAGFIEKPSV